MRTINRNIASAVIVSKDNKILMGWQDTATKAVYADCWHIPGGGIEGEETPVEAMQREVLEEVGLDVSKYNAELIDDTGKSTGIKQLKDTKEIVRVKMKFNDFKVVLTDKNAKEVEIKIESEFVKYKWCSIKDLGKIKLTPPSIKLFAKMGWL